MISYMVDNMDVTPCRGVVEIIQNGRSEMCVIDPRNTTDVIMTKGLRQAVPGSLDINVHLSLIHI